MTLQTLFDRMMVYDNQLDLIAGGDDVARGIVAANLVQDWWESVAAGTPNLLQTDSTFTTTANTEKTAWPTTLLRLDSLWRLDSNSLPILELAWIDAVGGHAASFPWPLAGIGTSSSAVGAPDEYYAAGQGGSFYWSPKPDAVYTMRGYGLWAASDLTTAASTFAYPDSVALAMTPFIVNILRMGLDRDLTATQAASEAAFARVVKSMSKAVRVGPRSKMYSDYHDT